MAENSKIEWCDHTVNLWWGCAKVHTGCKNCYAEHLSDTRHKNGLWGEKKLRKRVKSAFVDLDKYQKKAAESGIMYKVFVGSMMDVFEDSKELSNPTSYFRTTSDLREYLFHLIENGKYNNLIFLFLTKRPENIDLFIPQNWKTDSPKNVWFGASVSDQDTYNKSIGIIDALPSQNRFLSVEPQVGNIEIGVSAFGLGWVIQGGESGPNKRPFDLKWAYTMRDRCEAAGVPYFFKQIDKIKEIPEDLKIRQFPDFGFKI
jgi:protein gp37